MEQILMRNPDAFSQSKIVPAASATSGQVKVLASEVAAFCAPGGGNSHPDQLQ